MLAGGRGLLSLRGVDGGVAAQVAAGDEGLPAGAAAELFAVRVDAHVDLEGARLGEAFAAVDAAVALLARVDALVAFQVAGIGEALPTQRTRERLLARVHPHVGVQVLQGGQRFPAAGADKRPPAGATPPAAGAILLPPALPPLERVQPFCRSFPRRKGQRRPLLLLLCYRLVGGEAAAPRVRGHAHSGGQCKRVAQILRHRVLGAVQGLLA